MIQTILKIIILLLLLTSSLAWSAQKTLTKYLWDAEIEALATESINTSLPDANTEVFAVSGRNVLSVVNNTKEFSPYIGAETYWDSKCGWSQWTVIQNLTRVDDPENTNCKIRQQIIPLTTASTAPLRETWLNHGVVNYDVQVKLSWFYDLEYALSGVNVRWRESATSGKYEGYGVSFLYFNSQTSCSANLDYIPNSIKPLSSNKLRRKLLMVFWQQKVVGGIETRNWLAYAVMDDAKVQGGQSTYESSSMTDNVAILIRVEDVKSDSQRFSDIKIYYGEASSSKTARGFDSVATNIYRGYYPPECSNGSIFPKWPSNTLENYAAGDPTAHYWSYSRWYASLPYIFGNIVTPINKVASDGLPHSYQCTVAGTTGSVQPTWPIISGDTVNDGSVTWRENGTTKPTKYDYFTLLSADPKGTYNDVKMVINTALINDVTQNNNPTASVSLQADRATIRTTEFALSDYPETQPEIAIHGMGNLTGGAWWFYNYISRGVAFTDMAVQILGKRE